MDDTRDRRVFGADSKGRRVFHWVVSIVGWTLFIWAWYVVFYRRTPLQTLRGILVPGAFLVLVNVITFIWVRHNLAIYRRKGPRQALRLVEEDWSTDYFGRRLDAEWDDVREGRLIDLDVADRQKVFTVRDVNRE